MNKHNWTKFLKVVFTQGFKKKVMAFQLTQESFSESLKLATDSRVSEYVTLLSDKCYWKSWRKIIITKLIFRNTD